MPSLDSDILASLKKSEQEKDFLGQIYASYLLFRDTSERKYFETLKKIAQNKNFSDAGKIELKKITAKIEQRTELDFDDFDRLSFAAENNKLLVEN